MGVRFPSVASSVFVGPLPANANETVLLVTPPLNIPLDSAGVLLAWMADVLAGTGVSTHGYRIRRGTTTAGVQVGLASWSQTIAAVQTGLSSGVYFDAPGPVAGQQYALTLVQFGATAAGTYNDGSILAFAL